MNPQKKSVLVISTVDLFHKSGTIHNVIRAYIEGFVSNGFDVIFITNQPQPVSQEPLPKHLATKLIIHRVNISSAIFRFQRAVINLIRKFKKKYASKDKQTTAVNKAIKWSQFPSELPLIFVFPVFILEVLTLVALKRYYKKINFIYGVEPQASIVGGLIGKLLRVPSFSRIMGTSAYFIREEMKSNAKYMLKFPIKHISLSGISDYYIMTDDGTRGDLALKQQGINSDRILFIRNGVPKSFLASNNISEKIGTEFYFVSVSRLVNWKRIDRVIVFFNLLRKCVPEINFRLYIIGDGPEEGNLKSLSETLGLESEIEFLGRLRHEEVEYYIKGASAVISLYDYTNLTNQVLEASAARVPVISFAGKEFEGFLVHYQNAFLIPPEIDIEKSFEPIIHKLSIDPYLFCLRPEIFDSEIWTPQSWEERFAKEVLWIFSKL